MRSYSIYGRGGVGRGLSAHARGIAVRIRDLAGSKPVRSFTIRDHHERKPSVRSDHQTGGYFDPEFDMLKFGTRYYDPNTTRWTQPDPKAGEISNPMSLNAY